MTRTEILEKANDCVMGLLKIARVSIGNSNPDNWIDLVWYAACGGEIECKDD